MPKTTIMLKADVAQRKARHTCPQYDQFKKPSRKASRAKIDPTTTAEADQAIYEAALSQVREAMRRFAGPHASKRQLKEIDAALSEAFGQLDAIAYDLVCM
jgi:hypothetical protein